MTDLLHDVDVVRVRGDAAATEIGSIEFDSRAVRPGSLFCCLPGERTDGHLFAADAVDRGAVALVCERELDLPVSEVVVRPGAVRVAMAEIAAAFHGHPASALKTVGVTGTNGKTTVTHLVRAVLDHAGIPTGVIGTLDGARTTPEAPILQATLADLRDSGTKAVALEVSSHALAQHRVDAMTFDVAAFTNLSREHLDYHGTMEEYFEAKATLFTPSHALVGVVNADDPRGQTLLERARIPMVAVRHADATDIELRPGHTEFSWRGHRIATPLTGSVNVDNALMAAEAALALGLDAADVARGLGHVSPVPGRLQVIAAPPHGSEGVADLPPFTVLVDYAHTPAGLEVVLAEARSLARGRVVAVFGCGGNRDRAKRPVMGRVGARHSDLAYVTSDNPRDEDPDSIIAEVLTGVPGGRANEHVVVEPDRGAAIRRALDEARPGDVVVIAGKGHETYQEIAGEHVPFDDAVEARRALSARYGSDPRSWVVGAAPASTGSNAEV